jgi:YfiR/HmsC-like
MESLKRPHGALLRAQLKTVFMKKFCVFILCVMFSGLAAKAQHAQSKIQAIFVLKFIENVSWPNGGKNLVLGVVGADEVYAEIEGRIKTKNPLGLVVKSISASEASSCDAVFVASDKDDAISSIAAETKSKSVLVITESDFSRKGSCISFIEEAGRMHFVINKEAIEGKGLKVSSALLTLGKQV